MESALFTTHKKSDLKLLVELAKKMGVKSQPLSKNEIEDWILAKEIQKGLKTKSVSRNSIMRELSKK